MRSYGKGSIKRGYFQQRFLFTLVKRAKEEERGKEKKKGEIRKVEKKTTAEVRREYYRLF